MLRELPQIDEMVTLAKRITTDYTQKLNKSVLHLCVQNCVCYVGQLAYKINVFTNNLWVLSAIAAVLFHMT